MIPYSDLYNKKIVFLVIFYSHHEKNETGAVFDPRGLKCSSKWQHSKNRLGVEMMAALLQTHRSRNALPDLNRVQCECSDPLTWVQNKIYAAKYEPGVRYRKALQQM